MHSHEIANKRFYLSAYSFIHFVNQASCLFLWFHCLKFLSNPCSGNYGYGKTVFFSSFHFASIWVYSSILFDVVSNLVFGCIVKMGIKYGTAQAFIAQSITLLILISWACAIFLFVICAPGILFICLLDAATVAVAAKVTMLTICIRHTNVLLYIRLLFYQNTHTHTHVTWLKCHYSLSASLILFVVVFFSFAILKHGTDGASSISTMSSDNRTRVAISSTVWSNPMSFDEKFNLWTNISMWFSVLMIINSMVLWR